MYVSESLKQRWYLDIRWQYELELVSYFFFNLDYNSNNNNGDKVEEKEI